MFLALFLVCACEKSDEPVPVEPVGTLTCEKIPTMKALSVKDCPALKMLDCKKNKITSLDVRNNPELKDDSIFCDDGVKIIR